MDHDHLPTTHPRPQESEHVRPLPPLAVSGLVVTKAALVQALRIYVPQLIDLERLEDGRYLLRLAEDR